MKKLQMRKAAMVFTAACLGLAAASTGAQQPGSRQSREFVQAAASSDQFEILEVETGLTPSTNPSVRAFAAQTLQDHRRLSQAVMDAATRSGLKPPEMVMSADQAQWLGALQSVSGTEFDRLYLTQQTLAHRSALAVEQIYAQSGDDPGLRALATSAVPLISSHLDMANQMEGKV